MLERIIFNRKLDYFLQFNKLNVISKPMATYHRPTKKLYTHRNLKRSFIYLTFFGLILFSTSSISLMLIDMKRKTGAKEHLAEILEKHIEKYNAEDDDLMELRWRELRFYNSASVEYNGQIFMTPNDFLESIINIIPKPRLKRTVLKKNYIDAIKTRTPKQESPNFFSQLNNFGIISYTEYLFLMAILSKPIYSFEIAFKMFDRDGNHIVDKQEFQKTVHILSSALKKQSNLSEKRRRILATFMPPAKAKLMRAGEIIDNYRQNDMEDDTEVVTTLLSHFFGKDGKGSLSLNRFSTFLKNVQNEIITLEFNSFAKGFTLITEIDFANIIMRYTRLDEQKRAVYLQRLLSSLHNPKGITLEEFMNFMHFLNYIDDFSLALRIYTRCNQKIDKETLLRIVRHCTGNVLSKTIIDTLFYMFDLDDDGYISHEEFVVIMMERSKRCLQSDIKYYGWHGFKRCFHKQFKLFEITDPL